MRTEYFNLETNETAPGHRIGTTETGDPLYCSADGWLPIFPYFTDENGNWVMDETEGLDEEQVAFLLSEVTAALGDTITTNCQPCGTVAYYDEEAVVEGEPWRIADDHVTETYRTHEDAMAGALSFVEAYRRATEDNEYAAFGVGGDQG